MMKANRILELKQNRSLQLKSCTFQFSMIQVISNPIQYMDKLAPLTGRVKVSVHNL